MRGVCGCAERVLRDADVATWASTSRFGGDLIYAVDDLADELSTLRDGREVAGLSLEDDGVAESRDCAAG